MLTYDLKKKGGSPLYEQLYKCICDDINNGIISSGERLPSKRSLAEHLNISITTVENAYDHLRAEGYIEARPHKGFFVSGNITAKDRSTVEVPAKNTLVTTDNDFHENYFRIQMFPISVWTKLMRQSISDVNISMLHTVPWNGYLFSGKPSMII